MVSYYGVGDPGLASSAKIQKVMSNLRTRTVKTPMTDFYCHSFNNRDGYLGCVLISILACSVVGCRSTGNVSQQRSIDQSTEADSDLLEVVKQFCGDESKAPDAWQKLSSYPPPELSQRLFRIFRSLPENDHRRVLIAFVLCNLNYDYETNREIVRSSLSKPPAYEHFYADWPAALINRLIERGDIDLISQLFASANWADGAASTDLSGYFTKDFRKYREISC
jgi:hypothetical protein